MMNVSIDIDKDLYKLLSHIAIEEEKDSSDIVVELITDFVQNNDTWNNGNVKTKIPKQNFKIIDENGGVNFLKKEFSKGKSGVMIEHELNISPSSVSKYLQKFNTSIRALKREL